MTTDTKQTAIKVHFRKWDNGQIIALFPYVIGNYDATTMNSYMTVGQHSPATDLTDTTTPATVDEYTDLLNELTRIGYDVTVINTIPDDAIKARRDELARVIDNRNDWTPHETMEVITRSHQDGMLITFTIDNKSLFVNGDSLDTLQNEIGTIDDYSMVDTIPSHWHDLAE